MSAIESYIADLTSTTTTLQQSRAAAIEVWHEVLRRLKALESWRAQDGREAIALNDAADLVAGLRAANLTQGEAITALHVRNAELEARALALAQDGKGVRKRLKQQSADFSAVCNERSRYYDEILALRAELARTNHNTNRLENEVDVLNNSRTYALGQHNALKAQLAKAQADLARAKANIEESDAARDAYRLGMEEARRASAEAAQEAASAKHAENVAKIQRDFVLSAPEKAARVWKAGDVCPIVAVGQRRRTSMIDARCTYEALTVGRNLTGSYLARCECGAESAWTTPALAALPLAADWTEAAQ